MRTFAILLSLALASYAQSMEERLESKLGKDFIKNAAWETDYDVALKKSEEAKKPIFAYFTRSYQP